ncbi:MAG TPA: ROK family protein [Candidatus Limnocylindrales bacterium]|nr:ROK family protein [Candidatus Limnocylindrales bacterium]
MRIGRAELGQRSETVRRSNLAAITRCLHERGPQSRSELVGRTGLTRSAIRGLVGELAAAGFAAEEGAVPQGTPGRPSTVVRLVPDGAVVLGVEILVDSIAVAIVGLGGEVLERVRVDHARGHLAVDDVVGDLVRITGPMRERFGAALVGVGVAVAGVVRRTDGLVVMAPNLGWTDVPLGARLQRSMRLAIPVAVANEADLGALAEHRRGAAVGIDNVLFVSGEVGVGGGVITDGRPLTGIAGFAGEIGHLPLNPGGTACRCGSIGCWETETGEGALLARAGLPPDAGRAGVDMVLREAADGSPSARAALEHVGRWLGIGLAGLVNLLNPELILLGGMHGRILPAVQPVVEAEIARRALPASRAFVRILPARLGADAPLIGAAELAFEPLLSDPAGHFLPAVTPLHLASA